MAPPQTVGSHSLCPLPITGLCLHIAFVDDLGSRDPGLANVPMLLTEGSDLLSQTCPTDVLLNSSGTVCFGLDVP